MDLRRLLNTAYAAIVDGMTPENRAVFDDSLMGEPEQKTDHRGRLILRRSAMRGEA